MRYIDLPKDRTEAADQVSEFYDVCREYAYKMVCLAHDAYRAKDPTPYQACECALHALVLDAYEQGREDASRTRLTLERGVGSTCLDCGATADRGETVCPRCEGPKLADLVRVTALAPPTSPLIDGYAWDMRHMVMLQDREGLEDDLEGEGYIICDT